MSKFVRVKFQAIYFMRIFQHISSSWNKCSNFSYPSVAYPWNIDGEYFGSEFACCEGLSSYRSPPLEHSTFHRNTLKSFLIIYLSSVQWTLSTSITVRSSERILTYRTHYSASISYKQFGFSMNET